MEQQNESYTAELLIGMVAGALIAGALTVWYAPQSGRKTRADIAGWFRGRSTSIVEKVQGESVAQSLETGRAIAHTHRAEQAKRLTP